MPLVKIQLNVGGEPLTRADPLWLQVSSTELWNNHTVETMLYRVGAIGDDAFRKHLWLWSDTDNRRGCSISPVQSTVWSYITSQMWT